MKEEEKAIGLLDSGLGGLSVFKELKKQLPQEQIIYCGDTAHAPYGEKTDEEILAYAFSIIDFLLQQNVKMIIIACNTATAVALDEVSQKYALPIIGVINPGAREAVKQTRNKRIGIIGTQVTIRRQSYEKAIKEIDSSIVTYSNACSNQIIREMEEQALHNEKKITMLLRECVKPIIENDIDTLIWGCTHYPFLQKYIKNDINRKIVLIDPSEATVREARDWLQNYHLNNTYQSGLDSFFISGNPELFARIAEKLLGYPAGKFQKATF